MPTPLSYWFHAKGFPGFKRTVSQQGPTDSAAQSFVTVIPAMSLVDSDGVPVTFGGTSGPQPASSSQSVTDSYRAAGTDRSGTAGTAASQLAAANTTRQRLTIQNVSTTATLYVNEVGGTAAPNTAGSNTLPPGAIMQVNTNRAISVIASAAGTPYTAVEIG